MIFVQSKDDFLVKKQVNKLIEKININNQYEIYEYSLIDDSVIKILEEIKTYSFFSNKKIIIINDCWFVNESKIKLHKDFDIKYIEEIFNIKNTEVEIIMSLNSEKFSKKLKIAKLTEQNVRLFKIELPTYNQKKDIFIRKMQKANIDFDHKSVDLFIEKIPESMQIFSNEIDKLLSLNKYIDNNLIEEIVSKYYSYDTFEIANCFISNDISNFLTQWSSYKQMNNDIFSFIALLSSNFILLRNILLCKKLNYSNNEIFSKLNVNPYRMTKLLEKNRLNIEQINDKIKVMYSLEKNIKNGKYDSKVIPEIKFLKMFF
ncbi:DNA polymerase III subunit delta [Spiroplasma taiwanense]|uniref:DNA polymerase III subunit delta n=1 Tax=Spiroplasma taiwanense CT-1 TaxID=1276220 RepID=S5LX61_9MOLU|nr:hypothetical protein [Spiroplasma taiwanense]AGR41211.1 DNA polymerase III subunit delta [Spiroplasma taiwanense CT-1]